MNVIVKNFFQLGSLRLLARFIMGLRGLFIITSISPSLLGEYTIWLLYVFYFSFLELGILRGLERDLSHYRGQKDEQTFQSTASTGWTSFFCMSFLASLSLGIVSFIVFQKWAFALLLAAYLLVDKFYRGYDTNARVFFKYKDCGIAELIQSVIGFALIYFFLPRYGIYSIFPCFMGALIISTVYLAIVCRLEFQWKLQIDKTFYYIKTTLPLALMFYSIEVFNMITMTVVAFIWDKETLGYYAFAYRIFQICIAIFPLLIREVMRARMYFYMAESEDEGVRFQNLIFPMSIYSLTTSIFWLMIYWWSTLIIHKFVPEYKNSVIVLNILIFSLIPLGINKISSDFLCSRIYNKMTFVSCCWVIGIIIQVAGILLANQFGHNIFNLVPMIYVVSVIVVYLCVTGYAFNIGKTGKDSLVPMGYLLSPLAIAFFSVFLIGYIFHGLPSLNIFRNSCFTIISVLGTLTLSCWIIWSKKFHQLGMSAI